MRSNYGRDHGWKGIGLKEIEGKWMGPEEGFPRAEIMTEWNRGINEDENRSWRMKF